MPEIDPPIKTPGDAILQLVKDRMVADKSTWQDAVKALGDEGAIVQP